MSAPVVTIVLGMAAALFAIGYAGVDGCPLGHRPQLMRAEIPVAQFLRTGLARP
jgi:hypothetical protein